MHIRFADADENFIKAQVRDGYYTNETEAVRDAVRRMRENRERRRIEHIHALIAEGEAQIQRGLGIPYDDDFMDNAMKRAIENQEAGKPVPSEIRAPKSQIFSVYSP